MATNFSSVSKISPHNIGITVDDQTAEVYAIVSQSHPHTEDGSKSVSHAVESKDGRKFEKRHQIVRVSISHDGQWVFTVALAT